MHSLLITITLSALVAVALAACGREESTTASSKAAPAADARKSSKADEVPRVADPLREGY